MSDQYTKLLDSLAQQDLTKRRLTISLGDAALVSPDEYAQQLSLARAAQVSVDALPQYQTEAKKAKLLGEAGLERLQQDAPYTTGWLTNPDNAKLSSDDLGSLSALETGLKYLQRGGNALYSAVPAFNASLGGLAQGAAENLVQPITRPLAEFGILPEDIGGKMAEAFAGYRQGEAQRAKAMTQYQDAGPTESAVYSGLQSLGQNLLMLPAAVATGNPALALGGMAGATGGQAYGQARDKGLAPLQALPFAASQAAIEYATERLPVGRFVEDLAKNAGFKQMLVGQLAAEIPGEQVATILQDLNEWAVLNPDKSFKDYLADRPGAAYQTLVATVVGVGGNVTLAQAGQAVANRITRAGRAQDDGQKLQELFNTAMQSKLRQRAPTTFAEFTQQAAEASGTAPTELHIDARTFAQALNAEGVDVVKILADMPSTAQQLDQALATGGDIVVPIGEALAVLPGSGIEQAVLPHLRTAPDALSMAEAQAEGADQNAMFQQEAERVLAEQSANEAFQAEAQGVFDNILGQLNAANRFTPDVNQAYATLLRDFYVTAAGRTGVTPQAMFDQYPVQIGAQLPGMGNALNAEQAPLAQGGEAGAPANDLNLVATHNLSADNLRHAAELGGLAAPSLAITRKGIAFDSFGDITLIADKALIDPAKNPVFDADVYSPRHPRAKTKVNERKASAAVAGINALVPDLDRKIEAYNYVDELQRDGLQGAYNRARYDLAAQLAFVREALGEAMPIPTKQEVQQTTVSAGGKSLVQYEPLATLVREINLRDVNFADVEISERIATALYAAMFNRHIEQATAKYAQRDDMDSVEKNNAVLDEAETLTNRRIKMFTGEHDGKRIMTPEGLTKVYNLQRSAEAAANLTDAAEAAPVRTVQDLETLRRDLTPMVEANLPVLRTWIAEKFGSAVGERYLEQYTRTGNVTKKPYTLENVVKAMTKELRGGEGFGYGVGSARSQGATQFKNIEQMRAAQDRLVAPAEFEQVKANLNAKFNDLAGRIAAASGRTDYGTMDAAAEALGTSYKRGYTMGRALAESGFTNVPAELVREFQQFAQEVANAGTEYFEAKLQRGVGIGEFQAAVVPEGTEPDVLKILRDAGIKDIRTYAKGDAESRRAAIEQTAGSNNLLFQSAYTADTIEVDGVARPTTNSNGQRIAQTEEGLRNFWRWFGDSKVVDSGGKPLVVYHGTTADVAAFQENSRQVYFVTPAQEFAENYTVDGSGQTADGANIMPLYTSAKNPFDYENKSHVKQIAVQAMLSSSTLKRVKAGDWVALEDRTILHYLRKLGFDGLYVSENGVKNLAVFNPTQIKSAIGNGGEFDPANPSILNQDTGANRGAFSPDSLTITLLKAADLTTFLHESAHFFLTVYEDLAAQPNAPVLVKQDVENLLQWMGVKPAPTGSRLDAWSLMSLDEKRQGHEQFAESFEQWMFKGEAPSLELQSLFQRFRTWVLRVYKSLRDFMRTHQNAKLNPEIEQVFSRMLASNEQIQAAQQFRSMAPIFNTPEEAGMTPEQFAEYQRTGQDATQDAAIDMERRSLRDMRWLANAKSKAIKELQRQAKELRAGVRSEVAREVMRQPVYQAWQFLTGRMDKTEKPKAKRSLPNTVDATVDSMFTAIAKLGGLNKDEVIAQWGVDPKDKPQSGVFGKPVWRVDGGRSIDGMLEVLAEEGYLPLDENGKADVRDFEERFREELMGSPQYSMAYDYSGVFGDQQGGETVDTSGLGAGRLSRQAIKEMYGAESAEYQKLDKLRMMSNEGTDPDVVGEAFGFGSGDELVQGLAAATSPRDEIEAITDQRMLERHGELATPEDIERAAEAAIHNEARAKFVATELAALSSQLGSERLLRKAAKQYGEQIVARLKVRDVKASRYAAAEARAAKEATSALRKGDRNAAVSAKRNQLLNNAAARSASQAVDEVRRAVEYLKKFEREGTRKSLDLDYLEQIDAILDRYDLRTGQSLKAVDRATSLRTWVMSRLKEGEIPDIAETLLAPRELAAYRAQVEARDADGDLIYADDEERIKLLADAIDNSARRSYKDMTVEEFRGLVDTVRGIEHLGRLKHKLLTAIDQQEYEAVRDDIAQGITDNARQAGRNTRTANDWLGSKLQAIKQFGAAHIKVATWARIMDGGQDNGPVWRYIVAPANDRANMETSMRAEATEKLATIIDPVLAKVPMRDKSGKGRYFPTLGESLNWQERFAIALNTGNESNLQRLLGGRGWTMQRIMPVLNSLTADEWRAVQAVWDQFESYRPLIAEKERRVTGKEPQWIEARPLSINTADGQTLELRGGYYPVTYDPRVNMKAAAHSAAEEAKTLLKSAYSAATTRRSFTKERVDEVHGRPLLLNLQGMYAGMNDVIHDLAWHEWVIDANKLLRSKTIDEAIRNHYGPEVKREFEKWRDDIVAGPRRLNHAIEQAAGWARQGVSAAGLSFNLMSAAMQPLGLTQSIVRVGPQWMGKGIARYVAAPFTATREANERSEFMRNRSRTRFRELNELRNQVQGQTAARELMGRYGYFFMMKMQQTVDVPTWWGAYEKAIAAGENEDIAVRLADQAVKDAQGGGEEVDQSGVERGGPLVKLFTVFYSFMNTALNAGYLRYRTETGRARLAVDLLLLYTVPAVLGAALKDALTPGDSGDDDEEEIAKKLADAQLSYLMGLVAFGREFDAARKALMGTDQGMGYSGPAGLRLIPDTVRLADQANQGIFDDSFRKAFINVAGDLFGLPSAQINRSITGAQALAEGDTSNPLALGFGYQEPR